MPKTVTRSDAFVRAAMQEHGASVLRLALSQTSSMADAEDVYQDAFVSLACSKASFENADHLRAWLLRVTLNRCRDLARSWWRRKARSLDALEFDPPDDSGSTGAPADYAELWHAIRRLPKRDQVLIHLRYVEEMSCERISAVTGIKASTVRTRLLRIVASDPQEGVGQSSSDGDSYTINYQQGSGVGTYQTADGLYPTLAVYARSAEFWSSDPTLALLHKWVATGTTFDEFDTDPSHTTDSSTQRPDETDEEYRARQQDSLQTVIAASDQAASEYHESFDERAASSQSFRAWMKSLYIKNFEFCAEELAACRLEATVSFADGSTETHLYRISLVSSYEEVLSDRFDALCDLDGDFSRQLAGKLPWKSWATPTDEQIANDDRLSVPIFSIEEASE